MLFNGHAQRPDRCPATLTREDLKDLFPGPEHFRRRKAIWDLAHPVVGTDCLQYPTKVGLQAMARRIMDYYPMVADWANTSCPWSDIFKKLSKRLQNIKSPRKWQGATPSRGNGKRRRLSFENTTGKELTDEGEEPVLDLSPCSSNVSPRNTICTPESPQVHSPKTASENLSGKTVLANFLSDTTERLGGEYRPTQGVRMVSFECDLESSSDHQPCEVTLWDCSGNFKFESCWPALTTDSCGVVLVYNPTVPSQLREIESWFSMFVSSQGLQDTQCVLVAHRQPGDTHTHTQTHTLT
ncbi:uncharacterized protein LOC114479569 [Gouania willdenowi]|uniref:uncharacterized protein LOC114479569 n=1 Tax=Gouania willdenowi TaxID=441366 RepID=UPI001056967D|nr:uncharacterized protein LOC114479569 [Gouania willdenowi]